MLIIEDPNKIHEAVLGLEKDEKRIALVSTSGSLNDGHLALIEKAKAVADIVVVSTIVNALEFGPSEDFERYPRNSSGDADFCERNGVDILYRPAVDTLYPKGFSIAVSEDDISNALCGTSRPHYFRGVCTLHVMLFNQVRPTHLIMGRRDAQKCAVVRELIRGLSFPVKLHVVETVREASGLAISTRNAYLNEFQRRDAATLYHALMQGHKLVETGITNVDRILAEVIHHISLVRRLRLIYVAAVDAETMQPVRSQISSGHTLVMAAVWCDEIRLIDNILL